MFCYCFANALPMLRGCPPRRNRKRKRVDETALSMDELVSRFELLMLCKCSTFFILFNEHTEIIQFHLSCNTITIRYNETPVRWVRIDPTAKWLRPVRLEVGVRLRAESPHQDEVILLVLITLFTNPSITYASLIPRVPRIPL
jgi:hypothetical protein